MLLTETTIEGLTPKLEGRTSTILTEEVGSIETTKEWQYVITPVYEEDTQGVAIKRWPETIIGKVIPFPAPTP